MKSTLSRRRCTILILLFLLADNLNTDLSGAGPLGWLLCLPAAMVTVLLSRAAAGLGRKLPNRLWEGILLLGTFPVLDRMVRDFGGIIRTYNDFALSPGLLCLLMLATAFYLSRLRGQGLARTAELLFWPVMAILVWTYCVGLGDSDFGRLLPLQIEGSLSGLLHLLWRVFAQSLLVQAVLEEETEPAALRSALRDGLLLSGLILAIFLAKGIAQVGWQMASRFTYPLYALAGLTRKGSGMHIEDLLICALLAARLIKGALLLRLMGNILKKWRGAAVSASWTK